MIQIKRNIYAFGQKFLVGGPQCSKRAILVNRGSEVKPNIILTCSSCGFMQQWQEPQNEIRLMSGWRRMSSESSAGALVPAPAGHAGSDVHIWVGTSPDTTRKSEGLQLRLWLQKSCYGENLWFLNTEHLAFAESYVQVPDRFRSRSFDTGNSRENILWLSDWVRRSEDNEAILNCIKALKHER